MSNPNAIQHNVNTATDSDLRERVLAVLVWHDEVRDSYAPDPLPLALSLMMEETESLLMGGRT